MVLMYICICNALSDRTIREAAEGGANCPSEVYRACGCAAKCGSCAKAVRKLVQDIAYPIHNATVAAE